MAQGPPGSAPRKGIVVVDDDPETRAVLAEYLSFSGFDVLEAGDGLEALQKVKSERPHGVVLDLAMPHLGGLEALKRIRAFDSEIRVVIVSASADDARDELVAAGAVAVLSKPFNLTEILAVLRSSP